MYYVRTLKKLKVVSVLCVFWQIQDLIIALIDFAYIIRPLTVCKSFCNALFRLKAIQHRKSETDFHRATVLGLETWKNSAFQNLFYIVMGPLLFQNLAQGLMFQNLNKVWGFPYIYTLTPNFFHNRNNPIVLN